MITDICEQKKGIDLNVSLDNNSKDDSCRILQDSLPFENEVIDPSLQETSPDDAAKVICWRGEEPVQIPKKQVLGDPCIAVDFNTKHDCSKSHVAFPAEVTCTSKCMQVCRIKV